MSAATRRLVRPVGVIVAALTFVAQTWAEGPSGPPPKPADQADVSTSEKSAAAAEPAPAPSFGGPFWTRPKLTGDWGGTRDALRDQGITFDLSSTFYYQGVASGGKQDAFTSCGRNDYLVNLDGQKLRLWQGLLVNLHGETVYGDAVNNRTGALSPVNVGRAVPIPDGTVTCLTGAQVTQALSESFAVVAGKINTFDSFQQPFLPGGGLDPGFMNLGLVFNAVLARTIPYSTWGAGGVFLVDGQPAGGVFVFDTNNTPTVCGLDTLFDNGATIYVQGGLPSTVFGMPGQHVFMGTYSSGRYAETDVEPYTLIRNLLLGLPALPKKRGSGAVPYTGQQTLWTDPCDAKRSWGAFASVGISDGNPNPVRWSAYGGVAGSSPIAGRPADTFGVGYFYLGLSDGLKNLAPRLVPIRDEHGVELFYNAAVTPWCHVTPDLQVVTPARGRIDPALVLGARVKIDY